MTMFGGSLRTRLGAVLLGGASLVLVAAPGVAGGLKDEVVAGDKLEVTGFFAVTSDYIFRGLSFNRREVTPQGQVDLTYGIFYGGAFISGVDFNDSLAGAFPNAEVELDLYVGIKPKWRDVTFDFGVIGYLYSDKRKVGAADQDYLELKAGVSTTLFKDLTIGGTFFYSPEGQNQVGEVYTFEGMISKPIYTLSGVTFTASAAGGYVYFDQSVDPFGFALNEYFYYNAGVTVGLTEKLSVDFRYHGTDLDRGEVPAGIAAFQAGDAFQVTGKVSF